MVTTNHKNLFAKLLANENIHVRYGSYETPFFDTKSRVLGLPVWNTDEVTDLFLGHETSHALHTPTSGWEKIVKEIQSNKDAIPLGLYNVVEDVRIERLILRRYPGLYNAFVRGYDYLMTERDYFALKGKTKISVKDYNFIDRLNLKAKLRHRLDVEFKKAEQPYIDMVYKAETWKEVVAATEAIFEFMKEEIEKIKEEAKKNGQKGGHADVILTDKGEGQGGSDDFDPADYDSVTVHDMRSEEGKKQDKKGKSSDSGKKDAGSDSETSSDASGDSKTDEGEGKGTASAPRSSETEQDRGSSGGKTTNVTWIDYSQQAMTLDSVTDIASEKAKKDLIEKDKNGETLRVSQGMSDAQIDACIVPFDTVFKTRGGKMSPDAHKTKEFVRENKPVVTMMVQEFERRANAHRYAKASISKTGSLDMAALHKYRYTDDIFLRSTKLAESKNHGMIMVIDFSGSMSHIIGRVIRQALLLGMFCRGAQIPFIIYGFSDGPGSGSRYGNAGDPEFINTAGSFTFELLSSTMPREMWNKAFGSMVVMQDGCVPDEYGRARSHNIAGNGYECMGGTPLNESMIAMHKKCRDFRNRHNVEKLSLINLTDGAANYLMFNGMQNPSHIFVDGDMISYRDSNMEFTDVLLLNMKKKGIIDNSIHFYLTGGLNSSYMRGMLNKEKSAGGSSRSEADAMKEWTENGAATFKSIDGYDLKVLIDVGSSALLGATKDMNITAGSSTKQIQNQYNSFSASKRRNRVIVSKFSETIA